MAQQLVERRGARAHDLTRTARMAAYGGFVFGPAATLWYGVLQRSIRIPSRPNVEILARVAADQCVFASTNLFVFLSTMAVLEGGDPRKKLQSTYVEALKKNWMVWPVVQFTNFMFVPLEHRVLVVNVVSLGKSRAGRIRGVGCAAFADVWVLLGWNCYLSYLNSMPSGAHIANATYPPDV